MRSNFGMLMITTTLAVAPVAIALAHGGGSMPSGGSRIGPSALAKESPWISPNRNCGLKLFFVKISNRFEKLPPVPSPQLILMIMRRPWGDERMENNIRISWLEEVTRVRLGEKVHFVLRARRVN